MSLHLSPRQVEVCILSVSGLSDGKIGAELKISRRAVRKHLSDGAARIRRASPHLKGDPREVVREWYCDCRFQAFFAARLAA